MIAAMQTLPQALYVAEQARALDRLAIEQGGIESFTLMERAGRAAFFLLRKRWPGARRIVVVCGPGNNGGDGFVLAAAAHEAGYQTEVILVAPPTSPDARTAYSQLAGSVAVRGALDAGTLVDADVVVDAMFGTGLQRDVEGKFREAIRAINDSPAAVLAIDTPSGLDSDTGRVLGLAILADVTITFIGLKLGLFTGRGRGVAGEIVHADLGVPDRIFEQVAPTARRIVAAEVGRRLAVRPRDAHKGMFGHVLVVGGNDTMLGAPRMAGEAAYRSGAGLVTVATRAAHAALISVSRPELMSAGVETASDLEPLLKRATVVAVGPGLGRNRWAHEVWDAVAGVPLPKVVDADALRLLSQTPLRRNDWVLTPHPGEAASLLGCRSSEVQADRCAAVAEIVAKYGGVCILKGSGTLVGSADQVPAVCDRGHPGMATGGMGDVLTGVVAGLLAQGADYRTAAEVGAWLHASAADRAALDGGEAGLLATDLLAPLRALVNDPSDA